MRTPLHWAAANSHHETVSALVTAGADVNAQDKRQSSPLHWAAENGNHETVPALLKAGADVNAKNKKQHSPLHLASENGDRDTVSALLIANADVNARDNCQSSPLHRAALTDNHETVSALLNAGADVNALDKWRNTPLHGAARRGHPKCAEILLQHWADTGIRNKKGRTAKDIAADEDTRGCITANTKEEKERVINGRKEILRLLQEQNNGVSKRKKGYDPVLVRFYEERGMTKAKNDCPLIQEAAKESGKTVDQVKNFIGNYRSSKGGGKSSLPTDDTAARNSGFTGHHEDSGKSGEPDEFEETMAECLAEQQESHTETLSRTHEAVQHHTDMNNPTETTQVKQADEAVNDRSKASQKQPKKGGKRKSKKRHADESSDSGPMRKRPKQAVAQPAAITIAEVTENGTGVRIRGATVARPGPITIAEATENSIRTTWTEAAGSKDSYRISISTNDGVTGPSASVSAGDPLEHIFTGLTAGTEYTISVVTVCGGVNSSQRTKAQRTTVAQPGAINFTEVTENSISTTWTAAAGAKNSYRISINPDTGVPNSAVSVSAGKPREHTFTGLTAGTKYTISVVTVSGGANSVARTKKQRTTVAQPGPIIIAKVTENSIRITWTGAAGAKDSYRISISPTDGSTARSSSVNSGDSLEHTFTGLTAGTEYTIRVVSVSGGGKSSPSTRTQRTTLAQPGAINITEVTENSIRATWTAAAGAKNSYRISINPDTGVPNSAVSVNPGKPREHTFTGLTAGTEYTISVVAISSGKCSVARTKTQRTTVAQPGAINITEVTESSIRATWTAADGAKNSYRISISPDTGVPNSAVSVNAEDPLEHTYTGLTAGTKYTISVVTVSGGANSVARTKTQRTAVARPSTITIAEAAEDSIRITWTEADGAKDSYRISISPTDGATAPSNSASVNSGDPTEHTFTGLTAGTEYNISVVTVGGGEISVARTKTQRTNAAKPGPITIAEVTENSIRITWTEAAGTKDSYRISIYKNVGPTAPTVSVNTGDPLEHTFTTLTAGTEYTISAVTVSGGECSDPTTKVQRTKFTSVLLVNGEYGTSHGGPSTTNRQVAKFLKRHGATVHATALQASEDDKRCAKDDGVILHLPIQDPRDKRTPSLEWLTYYHIIHYPDIPRDLKCIVGFVDVTSEAAKRIQEDRCQRAKLILFNHDMPEDTEYYKGTKKATKMEDILEDAKNADAVFSLGRRIYNYFETKYKSLGDSKPRQHFLFLPRPSPVFEAISVSPGGGEKVVLALSVGRVTEMDKLKGHDLIARSMGEVAEKITNVSLHVRVIDEDDWDASKSILEENLHSGKIKPTLLPCGTQEDIARDMQQAHLVLMPSRAEPFGLIGLEAIAAGIPVLISDKSGLADMIMDLIEEEKCHPDIRHRIVETSVRESDLDVAAKEWAKKIVDTLKHSKHEFDKAAKYKKKLLESKYWEESHQNLLRVCGLID
ncbi:PREDICTED: uncharacterized protein LOC109472443 [Branchiostoma belcheri]|uniref:Uncharacterized protein LOC109472443 n=1 Tax=Branchiostoma belcheri TaxID=7741 RepID=A0A6P4ZDP9_BRABE|nr:PREDICTED: uncharacterized protein LOC109472443 [Branchiostoma belcheri]